MFGGGKKLAPVPDFATTANAQIVWQVDLGKSAPGLAPAVLQHADHPHRRVQLDLDRHGGAEPPGGLHLAKGGLELR